MITLNWSRIVDAVEVGLELSHGIQLLHRIQRKHLLSNDVFSSMPPILEEDGSKEEQQGYECDLYEHHLDSSLWELSHDVEAIGTDIIGHGYNAIEEQPSLIAHVEYVIAGVWGQLVDLDHFLRHEGNQHWQAWTEDVIAVEETGLSATEEIAHIPVENLIWEFSGVCCCDCSDIGALHERNNGLVEHDLR